jgi:hypothetical protein
MDKDETEKGTGMLSAVEENWVRRKAPEGYLCESVSIRGKGLTPDEHQSTKMETSGCI